MSKNGGVRKTAVEEIAATRRDSQDVGVDEALRPLRPPGAGWRFKSAICFSGTEFIYFWSRMVKVPARNKK